MADETGEVLDPVMLESSRELAARVIMDDFARSTGLYSSEVPRRYLWTDAFAVCNYLGLHTSSGMAHFRNLALLLVDQVHQVLGRHRDDDPRRGWISGLSEGEGARHPTAGGLRIGKGLPERRPDEPYDQREEWDRDGQYYHYLTKWIHALAQVWRATGEAKYHAWATELASAMHRGFVASDEGRMHICWKMSIDLSRALVPSTGHHDALDGFLVLSALNSAGPSPIESGTRDLDHEIEELFEMCRGRRWVTDDPLGVGGLLVHVCQCARLILSGSLGLADLLRRLIEDSETSLAAMGDFSFLSLPAESRLAFRELGLSIGFAGLDRIEQEIQAAASRRPFAPELPSMMAPLKRYRLVKDEINAFWMVPLNRDAETWTAHRDISQVMLATALAPQGFLGL